MLLPSNTCYFQVCLHSPFHPIRCHEPRSFCSLTSFLAPEVCGSSCTLAKKRSLSVRQQRGSSSERLSLQKHCMPLLQGLNAGKHAWFVKQHAARPAAAALHTHSPRCAHSVVLHSPCLHGAPMPWQQQVRRAAVGRLHAAAAEERAVSYAWSWQRGRSHFPEADSAFDQQHPLPAQLTLEALNTLLTAAAAASEAGAADADISNSPQDAAQSAAAAAATAPSASLPSQAWMQQLLESAQPLLQQAPVSATCEALQLLSQLDYTPDSSWMVVVLAALCNGLQDLSTAQLAGLVWSLSNLRHTPTQQQWQAVLAAAQARLDDFYGPDLATLVCGAGSILSSGSSSFDPEGGVRVQPAGLGAVAGASGPADAAGSSSGSASIQLVVPAGFADAVLAEVQYQITEFPADLGAFDLARIASGLADLGISPTSALQDRLMKAVYMRTRTIEEKGAVDFALAKLDAKGKKSMHYDPRWTHEELKWLPRRERDKRRMIKEGWVRTQWTGYS